MARGFVVHVDDNDIVICAKITVRITFLKGKDAPDDTFEIF